MKLLEDGSCDLDFDSTDLLTTDGLENAVLLSLGSFARESSLDNVVSNLEPARGGWWGDALDSEGTIGSHLYESLPSKGDERTLRDVEKKSEEALQWMIDDGIAKFVNCSARFKDDFVVIDVVISKPDGGELSFAYELNWEATHGI